MGQQEQNSSRLLGRQVEVPTTYDPGILRFESAPSFNISGCSELRLTVSLECTEFTSLCPITLQPDFGRLVIEYKPRGRIVESKSLKLYLSSFRGFPGFHEEVVKVVAEDLFSLVEPDWIQVQGFFNLRGGISINPTSYIHSGYDQ